MPTAIQSAIGSSPEDVVNINEQFQRMFQPLKLDWHHY